ncbi:hypothetical protein COCON_G00165470 [Conger conger]|uniref:Uncharacterized protein n=1 Tax=Conger conger TaxID=82655 RepID=A0A9Q1HT68_CONCO|nr:hypothetical protein COCON_G00165470 [Conger conger]
MQEWTATTGSPWETGSACPSGSQTTTLAPLTTTLMGPRTTASSRSTAAGGVPTARAELLTPVTSPVPNCSPLTSVLRLRVPSVWSEIPTGSELGWHGGTGVRGTMSISTSRAAECEIDTQREAPFPLPCQLCDHSLLIFNGETLLIPLLVCIKILKKYK